MKFSVVRTDEAKAQIRALGPVPHRLAKTAIRQLHNGPRFPGSERLVDQGNLWRVRLNKRWRLLFELREAERLIVISRIGLRDDIYDDYPHPHRSR